MSVWINDFIRLNKFSRPGTKLTARRKGVLHYTANHGATAKNHVNYFNNLTGRYASAHIFVDKNEARCIIPLSEVAYAANDGTYRGVPELRPNANFLSISVEMCQERDGSFHPDTIRRTEDVFVELSKMFNWNPLTDIVRHYDVTRKNCPAPWVSNSQEFIDFKKRVNDKLKGKKVSTPKPTQVKSEAIAKPKPVSKPSTSKWTKVNGKWNGQSLFKWQYGQPVEEMQRMLSQNNPPFYPNKGAKNNGIDSYFGNDTEDQVRRFQTYYKLKVDGIPGKEVYNQVMKNKVKKVTKPTTVKPKATKKQTVTLPASAKTWRTYKLNVQPVAKNSDWSLTPSRYGGLTYEVLGRPYPNVVTIKTSKGNRNIYVGKGTGAVIK